MSTTATANAPTANYDPQTAQENWNAARRASVTAPQGNLALIETRWFVGRDSFALGSADPDDALTGLPDTMTVTRIARHNIDTGLPEGGIRLWDADSAAIQNFDRISVFGFDADWVVDATFTPVGETRTIPFEHIRDNGGTRYLIVPGDITFSMRGVDYCLSAFDDGGRLLLVFADETNGNQHSDIRTHTSGRFLFVERTTDGAGPVVLVFNRAFIPPCGFSDQFNCPLPPDHNRFFLPLTAGEREVLYR